MTNDIADAKRDCGLDTQAMAEFAKELLDCSWMERIRDDLDAMNCGKVGHPFVFPNSMLIWAMMLMTVFKISYRLARGIVNAVLEANGFGTISLTQFYTRVLKLSMPPANCRADVDSRILAFGTCNVEPKAGKVSVAVDSTGLSLNKYGGWLAHRWNRKPVSGWVKLHALVDTDTNEILSYAITDESCGDVTCLDLLMEQALAAGHDIGKLLADAAYDSKAVWNKYSAMGIEVAININSSQLGKYNEYDGRFKGRSGGCLERGIQIKRIRKIGREKWKIEIGYGRRWKVECTFSDLKRLFGDILRSRAGLNDLAETNRKMTALCKYKAIRYRLAEVR